MGINAFDNIKAKLDSIVTVDYTPPQVHEIEDRSSPDGSVSQGKDIGAPAVVETPAEVVSSSATPAKNGMSPPDDELGHSPFDLILRQLKQNLGEHLAQERVVKMEQLGIDPAALEAEKVEEKEYVPSSEEEVEEKVQLAGVEESNAVPLSLRQE